MRLRNEQDISSFVKESRSNIIFLQNNYTTVLVFNNNINHKEIMERINGIF